MKVAEHMKPGAPLLPAHHEPQSMGALSRKLHAENHALRERLAADDKRVETEGTQQQQGKLVIPKGGISYGRS